MINTLVSWVNHLLAQKYQILLEHEIVNSQDYGVFGIHDDLFIVKDENVGKSKFQYFKI